MTAGSSLLALRGVQNKYLNYNPKHSFFTNSHVTYEPFAMESIEITANGQVDFNKTSRYDIDPGCEYITGGYFQVVLPALATGNQNLVGWCHSIGIYLIKKLTFKGQSQTFDTHYAEYIDLYTRFTVSASQRQGFNDMIGEINWHWAFLGGATEAVSINPNAPQAIATTKPQYTLTIPLHFWWCTDFTQALPVGVILYSGLRLEAEFRPANECYILSAGSISTPSIVDCKLYIDGVYIDKAARNRIAKFAQFYVIKQTQYSDEINVQEVSTSQKLGFTMPVSELVWGVREDGAVAANVRRWDWWDRYASNDTTGFPDHPIETVTLKLASQEIEVARGYQFYTRYLPWKYGHTSLPYTRGVYNKPFSLYTESSAASGDVNFSQSDNNILTLRFNQTQIGGANAGIGSTLNGSVISGKLYIFAINYNYIFISAGYISKLYNS